MDAQHWTAQGSGLYAAGKMEAALVAFQHALALDPLNLNTASACATLLSQLNQPQTAYQTLANLKEQLWADADGTANLAIAAEACGLDDKARAAYERALALDPDHVRSLNNLALWAAREGRWEDAVAKAARCVELLPAEPLLWMNWTDFLTGARREPEALAQLETACRRFPDSLDLAIRRFTARAFNADFAGAEQAFAALGPNAGKILDTYLKGASANLPKQFQKHPLVTPDVFELYSIRAFDALNVCSWGKNGPLTAMLGDMLAQATACGESRDWRDTQFYALLLDMGEAQQTRLRVVTGDTIDLTQKRTPNWLPFKNRRAAAPRGIQPHGQGAGERIRIGIATQNLADARYSASLLNQLALHDPGCFEFQLYTPGSLSGAADGANAQLAARLSQYASVVEIGHMSDSEAAARIRLDRLDLWMDTTFYTAWCRPELPALRVAPVQLRHQTWQRVNPPIPCEYSIGDAFTHPLSPHDADFAAQFGCIARFPHTCWLAGPAEEIAAEPMTREQARLPPEALVLCSFGPALMIDPHSFTQWMKMLQALPQAVLWLPSYVPEARANLAREAAAAGIAPDRILFADRGSRADLLAQLPLADLFLDTLRFNANHNLVDALRLGLPAVTVAGHNMASRLGGSIIRAAGLPDCVFDSAAAYVEGVVQLGHDPDQLKILRARLAAQGQRAPLFDTQACVREWEVAWSHMVARQRAGLAPQAFDVSEAPLKPS